LPFVIEVQGGLAKK